jgi:hypothetical protein
MSLDYLNDVRVELGKFTGDAPASTIAMWQSIVKVPIQVHEESSTGIKTYLVNDFDVEASAFARTLVEAGIATAKPVHLMNGVKLRKGWDDFVVIGPQVAVIDPVV